MDSNNFASDSNPINYVGNGVNGVELEAQASPFRGAIGVSGSPYDSKKEHNYDFASNLDVMDDGEPPSYSHSPLRLMDNDEAVNKVISNSDKYKSLVTSQKFGTVLEKYGREDLTSISETKCSNLDNYVRKFTSFSNNSVLPTDQLIFYFIRGLKKWRRNRLSDTIPKTLEKAILN